MERKREFWNELLKIASVTALTEPPLSVLALTVRRLTP